MYTPFYLLRVINAKLSLLKTFKFTNKFMISYTIKKHTLLRVWAKIHSY